MKKFTKFEKTVIVESLNSAKAADLVTMQEAIKAGKNPLFTTDYIEQAYADLIQKVKDLTRKNN